MKIPQDELPGPLEFLERGRDVATLLPFPPAPDAFFDFASVKLLG